jgi:hypothetical protein
MSSQGTFTIGSILSFIGGISVLVGGALSFMWFSLGASSFGGMMGGFTGMMGGYQGMMGSLGAPFGFMGSLSLIGLVTGIIVIISASMLNLRPAEHMAWGIIILIFSVISFIDMGGFMLGAILGIIGGALAISCGPISKTGDN